MLTQRYSIIDSLRQMTYRRTIFAKIYSCLPLLFWFCNLYRVTGHSAIPYMFALIVIGALGILRLIFDREICRIELLCFILLYFLTGLINVILIKNQSIIDVINSILFIGISIIMFSYPMTYGQGVVLFYGTALIFAISAVRGVRPANILTSSGNFISVYLILATGFYYVGVNNTNRKMTLRNLIPPAVCFLVCVWAMGRGGILSSLLLLLMITVFYIFNRVEKNALRYFIIALLILVLLGYLALSGINLKDLFFSLGKWNTRGADASDRMTLWTAYVDKMKGNPLSFLFGAPLDQIPEIHSFENNCHNSFIQLHAYNGIVMLLIFIFLYVRACLFCFKKKEMTILSVLLTLFVRGMTDKFIFGQYGMILMVYLIFLPYMQAPLKTRVPFVARNLLGIQRG